jgi:trimeric autotransporter adhesin
MHEARMSEVYGNSSRDLLVDARGFLDVNQLANRNGGIVGATVASTNTNLAPAELTGTSLISDGVGPAMSLLTLSAGANISLTLTGGGTNVEIASAVVGGGGGAVLVDNSSALASGETQIFDGVPGGSATTLTLKKLKPYDASAVITEAGGNILVQSTSVAGSSAITAVENASTAPYGLVVAGTSASATPQIKTLRAGYGISLTDNTSSITIASTISVSNPGVAVTSTRKKLVYGAAPNYLVKAIAVDSTMAIADSGSVLTLSANPTGLTPNLRIDPPTHVACSVTGGSFGVALGAASSSAGGVAAGYQASTSGTTGVALGHAAVSSAANATAVGGSALASAANTTSTGYNARSTAAGATTVGANSANSGVRGVVVGVGNTNTGANSVLLGNSITNADSNVLVVAPRGNSSAPPLLQVYGDSATGGAAVIGAGYWSRAQRVRTHSAATLSYNMTAADAADGAVQHVLKASLTSQGELHLPGYTLLAAPFGTAKAFTGASWTFWVVNRSADYPVVLDKTQDAGGITLRNKAGAAVSQVTLQKSSMMQLSVYLDTATTKAIYRVMAKWS